MDTMLTGFDFAVAYLDDILMKSKSIIEHNEHVHQDFTKIKDYRFKLRDQMWFFMEKIKYLGYIVGKDGKSSHPERAVAIKDILAPDNIASLQSFQGLINYYQIFISNMHDFLALLNELLKSDKPCVWTEECHEEIEKKTTDVWPISYPL